MIQEDYVTFEQAKILKELGFPQDGFNRYIIKSYYSVPNDITTKQTVGNIIYLNRYSNNPKDIVNYCTAVRPTLSLVQKWLREERNLHIDVEYMHPYKVYRVYIPEKSAYAEYCCNNTDFKTYEQALSAGIDKCLDYEIQNKRENQNL